jgi:hypothetical protein
MSDYDYRIVLENPDGTRMNTMPQGSDLDGARQRLQEILDDPDTNYPKGWVERRPNVWQTFCAAQQPSHQDRYLVKRVANAPWGGTQWAIWDTVEETWADDLGRFLSRHAAQRAASRAYESHEHLDLPDSTRP